MTDEPKNLTAAIPRSAALQTASLGSRIAAGVISLACATILGIGAWLTPAAQGHGSHTQLGLLPCPWVMAFNRPCPTCGMTTAVAEAAHGHFVRALVIQPFGFLVALAAAVGLFSGLHIAVTGSQLGRVYGRFMTPRILWFLAGQAGAAWAYKWATWPQS